MKKFVSILMIGIAVSTTGCASIVAGTTESIAVNTPDSGTGANCGLSNSEGMWTVVTPGSVPVKRSKSDLRIQCTKAGYNAGEQIQGADVEPWVAGNLILGGIIGIIVDWSSGAIHKYPATINVPMTRSGGAQNTPAPVAPTGPRTS